eukprot:5236292-Amphidinium_carterae.2
MDGAQGTNLICAKNRDTWQLVPKSACAHKNQLQIPTRTNAYSQQPKHSPETTRGYQTSQRPNRTQDGGEFMEGSFLDDFWSPSEVSTRTQLATPVARSASQWWFAIGTKLRVKQKVAKTETAVQGHVIIERAMCMMRYDPVCSRLQLMARHLS